MERDLELKNEVTKKQEIPTYLINLYHKALTDANNGKKLRVYIDETNNKYFIDVFAAFALGIISYDIACSLSDKNYNLYEITLDILSILKKAFGDNIDYHYINKKNLEFKFYYPEHPEGFDYFDKNENKDNYEKSNNIDDATHISYGYGNEFSKKKMEINVSNELLNNYEKNFNNLNNENNSPKKR